MMRFLLCGVLNWHDTRVTIGRGFALLFCQRCYQSHIEVLPESPSHLGHIPFCRGKNGYSTIEFCRDCGGYVLAPDRAPAAGGGAS